MKFYKLKITGGGSGYFHGTVLDKNNQPIYSDKIENIEEAEMSVKKKYPIIAVDDVDIDTRDVESNRNTQSKKGEDRTFDLTFTADGQSVATVRVSEGDLRRTLIAIQEKLSQSS